MVAGTHNLQTKLEGEGVLGATGRILRTTEGALIGWGPTVPALAAAGWATGAMFFHTDGGAGTALYVNVGDCTSCNFTAVA